MPRVRTINGKVVEVYTKKQVDDLVNGGVDPEPPPDPTPVVRFPGDPDAGMLYWGCTQDGNAEPKEHENATGKVVGIRRTFYQWHHRAPGLWADRVLNEDVNSGRLSWVSFKTPPWAAVGAGEHDNEIDELLQLLMSKPNPIWLTIFHEPEDNATALAGTTMSIDAWKTMQKRIRMRMDALGTSNVAFAPIFMAYTHNQTHDYPGIPGQDRSLDHWMKDMNCWDFIGFDHYNKDAANGTIVNDQWLGVMNYMASRDEPVAVGEWGTRTTGIPGAAQIRDWFDFGAQFAMENSQRKIVGLCCYDTVQNGDWKLHAEKLTEFRKIMGEPEVAHL